MLHLRRLICSHGQVRAVQLAAHFLAGAFLLFMTHHFYTSVSRSSTAASSASWSSTRPTSIYDYTDGKKIGEYETVVSSGNEDANSTIDGSGHPEREQVAFLRALVQKHGLAGELPWVVRRVKAAPVPTYGQQRSSLTQVEDKFLPGGDDAFARLRAADPDDGLQYRLDKVDKTVNSAGPLSLPVETAGSVKETLDASSLLFGISTSYARLAYGDWAMAYEWARWLTDGRGRSSGASLVVMLHGEGSQANMERTSSFIRKLGIDADVVEADESAGAGARYAELLKVLCSRTNNSAGWADTAQQSQGRKKFVALVDDDVFFPAMSRLVRKLSAFDASTRLYIGAPSDEYDWVIEDGTTLTYGGKAIFLSVLMAETVVSLPCFGSTTPAGEQKDPTDQWDKSLFDCVTSRTDTDLHVLPSYYVPLQRQTPYGVEGMEGAGLVAQGYGSGRPALTLHRARNWHRFDAGLGHLATHACGEDCFLQRFLFVEDDWLLVNGFTLVHYLNGVKAVALKPQTRVKQESHMDEQRKKLVPDVAERVVIEKQEGKTEMALAWSGRKKTYRLLDASMRANGEVWQAYVNKRGGGNAQGDVDDRLPGGDTQGEEEDADADSVVMIVWEAA